MSTQVFDADGNVAERLDDADWDPLAEVPVAGAYSSRLSRRNAWPPGHPVC